MAKKKARWRQGIVVSREGQPDRPATEDMALRYLRKSGLERDPDRKIQRLKQADVVGILGRINERLVDLSTYRPGCGNCSKRRLTRGMAASTSPTDTACNHITGRSIAKLGRKPNRSPQPDQYAGVLIPRNIRRANTKGTRQYRISE